MTFSSQILIAMQLSGADLVTYIAAQTCLFLCMEAQTLAGNLEAVAKHRHPSAIKGSISNRLAFNTVIGAPAYVILSGMFAAGLPLHVLALGSIPILASSFAVGIYENNRSVATGMRVEALIAFVAVLARTLPLGGIVDLWLVLIAEMTARGLVGCVMYMVREDRGFRPDFQAAKLAFPFGCTLLLQMVGQRGELLALPSISGSSELVSLWALGFSLAMGLNTIFYQALVGSLAVGGGKILVTRQWLVLGAALAVATVVLLLCVALQSVKDGVDFPSLHIPLLSAYLFITIFESMLVTQIFLAFGIKQIVLTNMLRLVPTLLLFIAASLGESGIFCMAMCLTTKAFLVIRELLVIRGRPPERGLSCDARDGRLR